MEINRDKLIQGVCNYVRNDILPVIQNNNLKFILATGLSSLEVNPDMANVLLENPLVKVALVEKNGMYDIAKAKEILKKTIKECGDFTITIPPIKFVLPEEQQMKFTSTDVDALFSYMERS